MVNKSEKTETAIRGFFSLFIEHCREIGKNHSSRQQRLVQWVIDSQSFAKLQYVALRISHINLTEKK